ncbi:hypothetical protein GS399_13010 [Pedobacter sp. HMF7647]|uniref:Uncharacterized protein n=1 Tax=Hufsiella arboris TaxID=2695275 RepID=A0A7K1YCX4_9SPHI|nr:hypothetical protein [Hufsiella arboris]MXV51898.1 hypothetical protein [Hufsiella arboris]
MIRKDFISAEIEKIAQVLARVLGFKVEGRIDEAHELIKQTLDSSFSIRENDFEEFDAEKFRNSLAGYPEKKLDLLAQFLFESAHPFEDIPETYNRLRAVLIIFDLIEKEYKMQSLDNLSKREMIDNFLNNDQYE